MVSDKELIAAARQARRHAVATFSKFKVGAALETADGVIVTGCNVENAAYPLGLCAEANAIGEMVLQGGRRIAAMLVIGDGAGLVPPCGHPRNPCSPGSVACLR